MLRLAALLGLFATLGAGCRDRTQIMIGVATDLRAPDLLDEVELEVLRSNVPALGPLTWSIPGGRAELFALPGSYGIYASDGSEPRVDVFLRGRKNGVLIVERRSVVSLVSGKTLFMRMGLVAACMNNMQCGSGKTCVEGVCRDALVDARTLPAFKPDLVTHLTCASGTLFVNTEDNSPMPMLPGMDNCGGPCSEGTCYEVPPDGGAIDQALWTPQQVPAVAQSKTIRAVWTSPDGQAFAVGDAGLVMRLGAAADGGETPNPGAQSTWVDESLPGVMGNLYAVFGANGGDVWAVGQDVILHRDATSWVQIPRGSLPQGFQLQGGVSFGATDAWAVGRDAQGNAIVAHWTGAGWTVDSTYPGVGDLKAVTGVPGRGILVTGLGGQIWGFNGSEWRRFEIGDRGVDFNGIWVDPSTGIGIAVGAGGAIVSGDGVGSRVEESGTTEELLAVWGTSLQNVFAVGRNGTILHTTGNGIWTPEPAPVGGALFGVFGSRPDSIYAVGEGGTVLFSGVPRGMGAPIPDGGSTGGGTDMGPMGFACGGILCNDTAFGCDCNQTCTDGKRAVVCDGELGTCECIYPDNSRNTIDFDVTSACMDPQTVYAACGFPTPPQ